MQLAAADLDTSSGGARQDHATNGRAETWLLTGRRPLETGTFLLEHLHHSRP
jgi:hypothetical protein